MTATTLQTGAPATAPPHVPPPTIHIFVEVSKTDHRRIEFDHNPVTGQEIKSAAGVPLENDLAHRKQGQLELVTNEQEVTLKAGDHFVSLPPGTIS